MNDIFKIVLCPATFWFSGMILCRMFFRAMFQPGIAEGDSTTSTAVTGSTTTGETRIRRKHYSAPI